MKHIISWLQKVEQKAATVYSLAGEMFAGDVKFKSFLEQIARDESEHDQVIRKASEHLFLKSGLIPPVSIEKAGEKIFFQLEQIKKGVEQRTIQREELIEKIVRLELSEWNEIYLYVIRSLKEKTGEFKNVAANVQRHIKKIEKFLEKEEKRPDLLRKIKELPTVWIENILIVEDEKAVADLVKALLYHSGNTDLAGNGREALALMEKKYYKLIVSDIHMPVMNGMEFYREAEKKYPLSKDRFLFMTGDPSPENLSFFEKNKVRFLLKPMDISLLREEAERIIIS